jgi:hypothetical protein
MGKTFTSLVLASFGLMGGIVAAWVIRKLWSETLAPLVAALGG